MSGGATFHGGRLRDACLRFGGSPGNWLDLSTGITPNPWPIDRAPEPDWRALPDPHDLAVLEANAARYFGIEAASCLAVPGSEAGLRAIGHILGLPGRHRPLTYATHAAAFVPATAVRPTGETEETASVLVLGNPNNPDGTLTDRATLLAALERQERADGWLLVDEAFADTHPEWSIAAHVSDGRRLIVTRSFGKFFGLAGIRLGFVIGPRGLLASLRRLQGEWPVCSAAIAYGAAAYADAPWIAATRSALPEAATRLDAMLARHGLQPRGACPLFRLVETEDASARFESLAANHILTRPFPAHPRLLRFGLPADDAQFDRLDRGLSARA